jgi:cell division protein FtsQ
MTPDKTQARNGQRRAPPARGRDKTRAAGKGRGKATGRARAAAPAPTLAGVLRRLRLVAGGLALLGVVGGVAWVWQSGVVGRQVEALGAGVERIMARGGLVVRSVTVEGRQRTEPTRLLAALETARGEPIMAFDPHAARIRVEALPWVSSARVERRLPDAIHVVLTEREPLALWQRAPDGDFALIDRDGVPVEVDTRPFAGLPVIVGPQAPAAVPDLMRLLSAEPALARRVRAAIRVAGRRWTVRLDDVETGIEVQLPETGAAAAWTRLADLDREARLLARDIEMVDLRVPDRLVVRPRPGALPTAEDPSAPTGLNGLIVSDQGQET